MADDPHYQSIRRAIITPTFGEEPEEQLAVVTTAYSQLAQEVVGCHNRIYVDQIAVAGGAGTIAIVLPAPFPDTFYSPLCILDWNAYGYVTAIAATGFTITFSAAA
ncbi:MAG TPA: hypothetical protein VN903_16555, partial [Polyangia bacterium]|nr:hypothetical protein [Polyangia bacterium]